MIAARPRSRPDHSWLLRELNGPGAELVFESIGCRLNLGSLCARAKLTA